MEIIVVFMFSCESHRIFSCRCVRKRRTRRTLFISFHSTGVAEVDSTRRAGNGWISGCNTARQKKNNEGAPSHDRHSRKGLTVSTCFVDSGNVCIVILRTDTTENLDMKLELRTRLNNIEYFRPNFEGPVLGCIDADFCK